MEAETVGYVLNGGIVLVCKHLLGTEDDEMPDPMTGIIPRLLLNDLAEMFRREMKEAGIIAHISVQVAVLDDGVVKAVAQALRGIARGGEGGIMEEINELRQKIQTSSQDVLPPLDAEANNTTDGF